MPTDAAAAPRPHDKFVKSGFVQSADDGELAVVWHSLFGHPKIVSLETLAFIDSFAEPRKLDDLLGSELTDESDEAVQELINDYFLVPTDFDDRAFLEETMRQRDSSIVDGSRIAFLELIMSESCNFRCTYCIHFNNLETSTRIDDPTKFMRFDTARRAVDGFVKLLKKQDRRTAEINFGGGEPLLAWPIIEQVLAYCVETYSADVEFRFSINTNASLITPEIAKSLREYDVEVASSLDGLREGNDQVRLTKKGRGTFDEIVNGFDALSDVSHPLDGFSVTVNERNFDQLDESIIDWAAEREMTNVRIDIDVIDMVDIPVEAIVDRLMRVRRYARERGISVPGFWSRALENMNDSTLTADVAFCGAVRGNSVCVSPSGRIYGCGYSTTELGRLDEIEAFTQEEGTYHRFVRDHLTGTMEMCKGCMIEGQCGGGCNITQEFARATHTAKIDRMCDFYRRMTQELLREELGMFAAQTVN